ncbi:protein LURP-one-related 15-like [Henckelia pumila]|uniref:protein LURP-one-related 15-like n=1 Tax=Henckelia pumila TaxID=405737 RepID=UPI003C6E7B58
MNMGGSSGDADGPQQVAVISPQFCVNEPIELTLVRKRKSFRVTDVNDNIMLTVKGKFFSLRERRVLYDVAGNPLITFQPKFPSLHGRWVVFRGGGESADSMDLLFSVKSKRDVFLATNTQEELCDFKIESSWLNRSCVIYAGGDSSNIVAKMQSAQSFLFGGDTFKVTVYSNVDYAFIVALVVILVNPEAQTVSVASS